LDDEEKEHYNYRDKSVLDLVDEIIPTQEQVMFLDEHYRSVPQIINFSNHEFYDNSLHIMTEKPEASGQRRVVWKLCQGRREQNGRNEEEAQQLVNDVITLVEEETALDATVCHSIGILSPFRDQVDYIFNILTKRLPLNILNKHNLVVGTAYTFQGEERDVMFLSFAIDADHHANVLYYLNRPDIFNVSITRGRSAQHIYTSITPNQIKQDTLLSKYLGYINHVQQVEQTETSQYADLFLFDVKETLEQLGIKTWVAYSIAGLKIDLVIEYAGHTYGIDLVGYPGKFEHAFSLERYKMFHRAGLKIFPLPYTFWSVKRDECLHELKRIVGFE
jgi:hypothetical protein